MQVLSNIRDPTWPRATCDADVDDHPGREGTTATSHELQQWGAGRLDRADRDSEASPITLVGGIFGDIVVEGLGPGEVSDDGESGLGLGWGLQQHLSLYFQVTKYLEKLGLGLWDRPWELVAQMRGDCCVAGWAQLSVVEGKQMI